MIVGHLIYFSTEVMFGLTASPEVIIMRRRIVSNGYAARAAPYSEELVSSVGARGELEVGKKVRTVVQPHPTANDARKLPCSGPMRTISLMVSYPPKLSKKKEGIIRSSDIRFLNLSSLESRCEWIRTKVRGRLLCRQCWGRIRGKALRYRRS